jgi:hypothetical protein
MEDKASSEGKKCFCSNIDCINYIEHGKEHINLLKKQIKIAIESIYQDPNELVEVVTLDIIEVINRSGIDDVGKFRIMVHVENLKQKILKLYNKPKKPRGGFKLKEI